MARHGGTPPRLFVCFMSYLSSLTPSLFSPTLLFLSSVFSAHLSPLTLQFSLGTNYLSPVPESTSPGLSRSAPISSAGQSFLTARFGLTCSTNNQQPASFSQSASLNLSPSSLTTARKPILFDGFSSVHTNPNPNSNPCTLR